jgi:hypothetical protein
LTYLSIYYLYTGSGALTAQQEWKPQLPGFPERMAGYLTGSLIGGLDDRVGIAFGSGAYGCQPILSLSLGGIRSVSQTIRYILQVRLARRIPIGCGQAGAAMKRVKRMAALATALVVTSAGVRAQESDVAAGHAFARNACQPCHAVEAEQRTPRRIVIGPAFRDVATPRE